MTNQSSRLLGQKQGLLQPIANVRLPEMSLGRTDFLVPLRRNFGRRFLREVSNAPFEIKPESNPIEDVHERLAARANPRCKASSQSVAAAGPAGPLFRASFTHP